jgi:ABC-type antimicrobial peptide transport system permease subunit
MTGTGMLAGLAASLALTRLVASLLFRVAPLDPIAFASAAAILAATSTVACIVPALRAIQADPLESVKSEV